MPKHNLKIKRKDLLGTTECAYFYHMYYCLFPILRNVAEF